MSISEAKRTKSPLNLSRRTTRIAAGVLGVGLFGGGIALGTVLPDPKSSDDYLSLALQSEELEAERDSLQSRYSDMKTGFEKLSSEVEGNDAELQEALTAVEQREAEVETLRGEVEVAADAVKAREDAVSGAEEEKAANTIAEGTWTVGVDVEPGAYRTTENVGSKCYWGIYTSGTNGEDIQANDIPGGGRPTVTLSEGQDFETARCGSWERQ